MGTTGLAYAGESTSDGTCLFASVVRKSYEAAKVKKSYSAVFCSAVLVCRRLTSSYRKVTLLLDKDLNGGMALENGEERLVCLANGSGTGVV